VTGATGFVGTNLVDRLLAAGATVKVLARSPASAELLANQGVEVVVGDIASRSAVAAAVSGANVVYHLAGRLLVAGVAAAEYQRTHVYGTGLLLACCRQAGTISRFVHCSTTGVLGVTGDRLAREDAPIRPTNVYEATKAAAEVVVRSACDDGFPAVIVRPGLVYGPGDLHLLPFVRAVVQRRFRPIGRTPVWLHPVYIDDVTEALVRCGERAAAVGECFHIAGPAPVPLAELADAIAKAAGTRLPRGYIPAAAASVVAAAGDRLPAGLGRAAPLTSSRLDFLTHNRMYDVGKARQLLDFAAATDLPAGAARAIEWYRVHGYLPARHAVPAHRRTGRRPWI
jgi:nucleoside-diphosphate-sugar epimerase